MSVEFQDPELAGVDSPDAGAAHGQNHRHPIPMTNWRSLQHVGASSAPWPRSWNPNAELQSRPAGMSASHHASASGVYMRRRRRRRAPVSSAQAARQRADHQHSVMPSESLPATAGGMAIHGSGPVMPADRHSYASLPPGTLTTGSAASSTGQLASPVWSRLRLPSFFSPSAGGSGTPQRPPPESPQLSGAHPLLLDEDVIHMSEEEDFSPDEDAEDQEELLLYTDSYQCLNEQATDSFMSEALDETSTRSSLFGRKHPQDTELPEEPEQHPAAPTGSSFLQTTFNAMNIVAGVALLSMPYSIAEAGLAGLTVLLVYAAICTYTGCLLRSCMDCYVGLQGYPDIGWVAFGSTGRLVVGIILYVELFMLGCELLILGGDSLTVLFPQPSAWPPLAWAGAVPPQTFWTIACCVLVVPTMFIRNLSLLSYFSAAGIFASTTIVLLVVGDASTKSFGSHWGEVKPVQWEGLPLALGMYAFCYSGHAVFPNLYTGMSHKSEYSSMLCVSLGLVSVMYVVMALVGFGLQGASVPDNIVVGIRKEDPTSIWAIVGSALTASLPFTKFALSLSPVAEALEELLPVKLAQGQFVALSMLLRMALVVAALVVALSLPFFGYVAAVIGSMLSVTISVILPTACYARINWVSSKPAALVLPLMVCGFGVICAVSGTYMSISRLVEAVMSG